MPALAVPSSIISHLPLSLGNLDSSGTCPVPKSSTLPSPINTSKVLSHHGNMMATLLGFYHAVLSVGLSSASPADCQPPELSSFFCPPLRGFPDSSPLPLSVLTLWEVLSPAQQAHIIQILPNFCLQSRTFLIWDPHNHLLLDNSTWMSPQNLSPDTSKINFNISP